MCSERGGLFCGTVPARERLDENVVVCPCCRSKFHRWGHLQSFDCARIRTLLEQDFDVGNLSERDFVTWGTLNWKGRIRGVMRDYASRAWGRMDRERRSISAQES